MKALALLCVACLAGFQLFALDLGRVEDAQWELKLTALNGQEYKLKDFRGKYVLLHFWNTWCTHCWDEISQLDQVYDRLSKYMKVLPVVGCEKPEAVRSFLEENGIRLPVFLDEARALSKSFNIQDVPSDRVINPEGKIVVVNTGRLDWLKVLGNIEKEGGIIEQPSNSLTEPGLVLLAEKGLKLKRPETMKGVYPMEKVIDCKKHFQTKTKEEDVPGKLARFQEYVRIMKTLALEGSDKYAGAEVDEKEAMDLILDMLGKEGFTHYVLGDLIKRVVRFKNQKRERDLPKIGLWTYFLWAKLFPR
jgi:peroxiredoxin